MAMKYVNYLHFALALSLVSLLSACGGNVKKTTTSASAPAPGLVSTQEFIPVPKVDKEGNAIPYEARPNPYLQQKGRIKKESVDKFVNAKRALKFKQEAQAEKMLLDLTEADKNLSGPWVALGDIAIDRKNYDQAIEYFNKAIALNRHNMNAYMRLALALRLKGDFLRAQNVYADALRVWPDSPEAHLNLAVLYDVYLNHPLRAQKHMEAYQFLTAGQNKEVAGWLNEVQKRTSVPVSLDVSAPKAISKPLDFSGGNK
jgi:tetratricopeptide (TPR) repeat protein